MSMFEQFLLVVDHHMVCTANYSNANNSRRHEIAKRLQKRMIRGGTIQCIAVAQLLFQ